ncbi:uncharacterized protein TRIADDRAFT_52734 [Trichoplax adhaerens]|uniref:MAGUK p55 subfamily member 5 n=1 Tax=Trichoplax adhaerens TaxID=10228 RepID=B3RK67_TRIAD|nr:hypothetical protein TRIADDRAFT_52734 [Trichoplax adhaerens]EDV29871.1 hypothetical protein TRIADDRAFT_52734 [Trichoplax adhaerens]|eukprot:XP_002109073.1 hypothetical protein TRIADDRAFT_52734 [Trichoplax adhaerens]
MPTANFKEFDILISLVADEERFGFSVTGGIDKGAIPRIGKVANDSPAIRAKLKSGDELLAINGNTVANATFSEIVAMVQKGAKMRYVRLTVKRIDEVSKPQTAPPPPPPRRPKTREQNVNVSQTPTANGNYDRRNLISDQEPQRGVYQQDQEFLNQFDHRNVDNRRYENSDNAQNFDGFDEDFGHTNADIRDGTNLEPENDTKNQSILLGDLSEILEHLKRTVTDERDKQDLKFLYSFCQHKNFKIAAKVISDINEEGGTLSAHLKNILTLPNVTSLMYCHDEVASKDSVANGHLVSVKNDDYCYRLVEIHKAAFPLGATIRRFGDKVLINRIARQGAADRSGQLSEGDEIVEINGTSVVGMTVAEIVELVEKQTDIVAFLTLPGDNTKTAVKDSHVYVKAFCEYNPIEDQFNPYRELGLKFQYGDILRITPQEDKNWWQAQLIFSSQRNVNNKSSSGIIPSRHLMEQRQLLSNGTSNTEESNVSSKGASNKSKKWLKISGKSKKKKSNEPSPKSNSDADAMMMPAYEPVREMPPTFNRTRPIVLIGVLRISKNCRICTQMFVGAKYIGRNELKHRLLRGQPERFAAAIECTTRTPRPNEVNGVDFHFMTRDVFERKKANQEMLEYRESNGQLYGVDKEAVKKLMFTSKSCLLIPEPDILPQIKGAELRPFVIFIRAPFINEIGKTSRGNYDCINFSVKMKNDAVRAMVSESYEMESKYKQYFDVLLVNNDMVKLVAEVQGIVESLTSAPQWVPSSWMH